MNKPRGLLTDTNTVTPIHPGGARTVVQIPNLGVSAITDGLIDFVYGLPAPYRQNARWLMNSMAAAFLAKLKDSTGDYLWRETSIAGQPAALLGDPMEAARAETF